MKRTTAKRTATAGSSAGWARLTRRQLWTVCRGPTVCGSGFRGRGEVAVVNTLVKEAADDLEAGHLEALARGEYGTWLMDALAGTDPGERLVRAAAAGELQRAAGELSLPLVARDGDGRIVGALQQGGHRGAVAEPVRRAWPTPVRGPDRGRPARQGRLPEEGVQGRRPRTPGDGHRRRLTPASARTATPTRAMPMECTRCAKATSGRAARRSPDRTAAGRPATECTRCRGAHRRCPVPLHRVESTGGSGRHRGGVGDIDGDDAVHPPDATRRVSP
ncbi:hypothetical protein T45_08506 [Streptomyces turgidiscabies]|nr:hypothetical protein T45_08506 [Streptomyces turgidiscabies]